MFVTALARNQLMCTIIELKLVYTDNQKDLETLIFRLAVDTISPDTRGFWLVRMYVLATNNLLHARSVLIGQGTSFNRGFPPSTNEKFSSSDRVQLIRYLVLASI